MKSLRRDEVHEFRDLLLRATTPAGGSVSDDRDRVDLIAELEAVKSAACAAQAALAVALDRTTRAREAADGVPAERCGRGVAAQVGLARRESPHRGSALLGLARDLHSDLPHTRAALAEGRLSEHAATLVARELGCLDREGRTALDTELFADPATLDGVGTARLTGMLRARVAALDPAAVTRRARRAVSERHVSLRPAPDAMTYLTALLPVAQGVACHAALGRAADTTRATGAEGLSRGQVMADTLVQRVTGQATAEGVPVSVDLILSDASLLGAGSEPAVIPGHGPVPAQVAREMVANSLDLDTDPGSDATPGPDRPGGTAGPSAPNNSAPNDSTPDDSAPNDSAPNDGTGTATELGRSGRPAAIPTWLRRIYADPSGQLVALTSRRRFVADGLAALLRVRDQGLCRTPYCNAPARHLDHVVPDAEGGPTTAENTQGLCEACNYRKDAPGWAAEPGAGDRHAVVTTTPTGHRYRSRAPAPPTPARPTPGRPTPAPPVRMGPGAPRLPLVHVVLPRREILVQLDHDLAG